MHIYFSNYLLIMVHGITNRDQSVNIIQLNIKSADKNVEEYCLM